MTQHTKVSTDRAQRYSLAMEFAGQQLRHLIEAYPDSFPMYTLAGKWVIGGETWTNWCEGFLGGQLWLLYGYTGDPYWRDQAEHYSRLIEHRKTDRSVHDLGFLFWPTWKRWYDLTRDEAINAVVIEAGRTLALRFKERGGYLCSFVAAESGAALRKLSRGDSGQRHARSGKAHARPEQQPAVSGLRSTHPRYPYRARIPGH